MNEINLFIQKYLNSLQSIIRDYQSVNNGVMPLIAENGLLMSPSFKYKLPPLKFIIGKPASYNSGEELPFLKMKEDKYNYFFNKVTFKDLNVFEKTKVSVVFYNKIKALFESENVNIDLSNGKSWIEENEEVCYLYIKGAISKRAKKELLKIINSIEIIKEKPKSLPIMKKRNLVGKVEIIAKLKEFEIQERVVSENKINKRYVGLFKTDHGEFIKGTIPKKLIDLVQEDMTLLLNKEVEFLANFREREIGKKTYYFSSPVKAKFKN